MKTSRIILYIVIAAVVYYLIYKAVKNYNASGSVFKSSSDVLDSVANSTSRYNASGLGYNAFSPDCYTPTKSGSCLSGYGLSRGQCCKIVGKYTTGYSNINSANTNNYQG